MNTTRHSRFFSRLTFRVLLCTRDLGLNPSSETFGRREHHDAIQRIYVINLDREPNRWGQMNRELGRLRDRDGKPLAAISRRFSAVDARFNKGLPSRELIQPHYSLADQLFVQPNSQLEGSVDAQARSIEMTPQEVAVALSHIEVWKLIAENAQEYTLVLEDDVYFRRGFARSLDDAWAELMQRSRGVAPVDVLYLSYKEAKHEAPRQLFSELLFRPVTGLWQLSGYVLSKNGAQKLLGLLPVRGPVDLWLNHQFKELDVFATQKPIIVQRPDLPSTNSYSILPILSEVGVLTREKPLLVRRNKMPGPVFAFGQRGTGLTALAMALSMLGYRCCSDITELPASEHADLLGKGRGRVFDAYVNIGSLKPDVLIALARIYRRARFIITVNDRRQFAELTGESLDDLDKSPAFLASKDWPVGFPRQLAENCPGNVLILPVWHRDKWELLSNLLGCDYPAHRYPECEDQSQRLTFVRANEGSRVRWTHARQLKGDSSPWVIPRTDWSGLALAESGEAVRSDFNSDGISNELRMLDSDRWILRDDTFPSNLALFRPGNFAIGTDNVAQLTLREERTAVRQFTSASIASRERYLFGHFVAEVRPSNVPGLITGIFLHRNSPRQEIDLEFLGRDTTKLLVNVYYNPGADGTKLEYGYRGTPTLIDLGFDAASEFHRYEIEWCASSIRWRVDGRLVHERLMWDPTPIPHLPMQFNVNLWHSRSKELAGKLAVGNLPAQSHIRFIGTRPDACQNIVENSKSPSGIS